MNQAESPKKFQVQARPKRIMTPNDKLTRTLFNLPENEFVDMILNGVGNSVTENPKNRNSKVKTKFWIENVGKCELSEPLNEFDRMIFDTCATAKELGFDGITISAIWHVITGGKDTHIKIRPEQKAAVLESVRRLMSIRIKIDFSQAYAKMKQYRDAGKWLESTIMPCKIVGGVEVNGQPDCDVVFFYEESALMTMAKAKAQMLTYDAELLDVPKQNNTPFIATLKSYLMRCVIGIIKHPKDLKPIITFADVFKKCRVEDADRDKKFKIRKVVRDVFEHLKIIGVIRDFEFKKIDGIYHGVAFNY